MIFRGDAHAAVKINEGDVELIVIFFSFLFLISFFLSQNLNFIKYEQII